MPKREGNYRLGITCAIATYILWGVFPLYWALLDNVDAFSILAQRIVWTLVFMFLLVGLFRRQAFVANCKRLWADKKRLGLVTLASLLISANWLIYIWAVNNNHVLDTSIGYYLNPLVSVLLGVLLFGEYLIIAKRISVGLAAIGIIVLAFHLGHVPWIALGLALSFGLYGAVKKKLFIDPFSSITIETLLVSPLALIYLCFVNPSSWGFYSAAHIETVALLMGTGVVTAIPLILFSFGANHLPLNILGFTQYISPTIAFLLAIFYFKEGLDLVQLGALCCIWAALVIFTVSERFITYRK